MAVFKCSLTIVLLVSVVQCAVRQKRIVGGNEVDTPPLPSENVEEDRLGDGDETVVSPTVIKRNSRVAKFKGVLEPEGYHAFRGIRYAEPPVGRQRFQRPQFLKASGEIDATKAGSPCIQPTPDGLGILGSEDCLFLNVYTPELPTENGSPDFPVLMWIHGGGFRRGSASQYDGVKDLVNKGLVVVTVQYRLGSLGFLSTHRNELPGNTALFDLGAALEWINKYIGYFGGDPRRIFPSGQGSGASAASMLSLSGLTQAEIAGIFAMSGSALSSFAVDPDPRKSSETVSAIGVCNTESDALQFVRCMQQLPVESIIEGDNYLQNEKLKDGTPESFISSLSSVLSPGPSVERENDDRFLPFLINKAPIDTLKDGNISSVPLLIGVTKGETSTSVKGGSASKLLEKLESVPDYLENSLVPNLLNVNTGLFSNGQVNPLLRTLFSNNAYLKAVSSSLQAVTSTVDKAIEVTTDALFNLPAFMTSLYWTKQNKAYLYSFEHEPTQSTSKYFLNGSPLVQTDDNNEAVEGVGHGDDLVYLFDVRSIDGVSVPNITLSDPLDLKVRDHFTSMVAEFARTGIPKIEGKQLNSFSDDGDYLKLTAEPAAEKGFRKCQMGLWAGIPELLKSAECSFLGVSDFIKNTISSGVPGLLGPSSLRGLPGNNFFKTASNVRDTLRYDVPTGVPIQVPTAPTIQGPLDPGFSLRRPTINPTGMKRPGTSFLTGGFSG